MVEKPLDLSIKEVLSVLLCNFCTDGNIPSYMNSLDALRKSNQFSGGFATHEIVQIVGKLR